MTAGRPADHGASATDAGATGVLTVDLEALAANYAHMRRLAGGAECAAVVKADGYGLGAARVAAALLAQGCRAFFVATPDEAMGLRAALPPDVVLYVLDGLLPGAAPLMQAADARPVLGGLAEIEEWAGHCASAGERLPAAIHVDTGMNRLGLPPDELDALCGDLSILDAFELTLVMSHLACADEPDHPKNGEQRERFEAARARLPPAPASLANSGGVLLGSSFHYDMVRPGIALYGGNPLTGRPNPMRPVVRLEGRIAQVREARAGETVGYGAARTLARGTRVATVAVGYADGYFRLAGSRDGHAGAVAYVGEHPAPLLGRVSMDLIAIDVTDVPDALARRGGFVELLGPHVGVDDLAAHAQTIGYEALTSLGPRFRRVYRDG